MATQVNFPNKEQYGEHEGERWSIFVKYDTEDKTQDFYLVNKTTGNWKHFNINWFGTKFPINYYNFIEWENTQPEVRRKLGVTYSWMSYMDKCGQIEVLADPSWWL